MKWEREMAGYRSRESLGLGEHKGRSKRLKLEREEMAFEADLKW